MARKVYVIGVGMTKFEKPGSREWDSPDMAKEAGTKALEDAGIPYGEVEQAAVGYVYGESTSGQRAVYQIGLTGIPVYNVKNNCSTGSTALFLGKQLGGFETSPVAPQIFGNAGREHMERYGSKPEQFAKIGLKNHRHSVNNPYSQFQDEYTLEEILAAPMVHAPLTKLQCCPTSDGSAAAVLASEEFVHKHSLEGKAVEIIGQAMVTDTQDTFESKSSIALIGSEMTRLAARRVYEQTGLGPEDVDVIELHDCFSSNEMITYEALGLCGEGEGGKLIDEGAVTYGGQWVVNPSGGLISKGHPLGATGLAQCSELNWQLRGESEKRQVSGAKVALQHNIGLGGAVVVTMYRKGLAA